MPKSTLFSMNSLKNRPSLGATPDILCLRRLGGAPPDPALAPSRYDFLAARLITSALSRDSEKSWKQTKINLILKSAAPVVTRT